MNKFMFAIENIIKTMNKGKKAILYRNQNKIINRVIFYNTLAKQTTKYQLKNEKIYDRKEAIGFYKQVSTNRTKKR